MVSREVSQDKDLVRECLSGSQDAWNEFYCRFERLIKSVIRRQLRFFEEYLDDVCQDVLMELVTALKTYDSSHSLTKFVCIVTERVCIDHYRFSNAEKRSAKTQSLDQQNSDHLETAALISNATLPDEQVSSAQLVQYLRICIRRLSAKCREILKMRYEQDLPFKQIGAIVGASENTVTVQARRCMDELKALYHEMERTGARP